MEHSTVSHGHSFEGGLADGSFGRGRGTEPNVIVMGMTLLLLVLCLANDAAEAAPRAARSVHLWYPAEEGIVYYNEVTARKSYPGSYFCVCGFRHGYFGIQELWRGRKVVPFSVWDPGKQNNPTPLKSSMACAVEQMSRPDASFDENWELVWSDEFNYEGLPDQNKWDYETGFVRNREKQYYTKARAENARVDNGTLIIESRKEKYEKADYTSASLHTWHKAEWLYGRIEVRAKLPTGRGMWPAIWMLGTNRRQVGWPACGEIDIMENVGFDPDVIHANIHTRAYNHVKGTGKGAKIRDKKPYEQYHVYAIEWDEGRIDFFFDDEKYFTFGNEGTGNDVWPFDKPHYLILNAAIGGSWGGQKGIDDAIFPQKYHIDYVRIFRKKSD